MSSDQNEPSVAINPTNPQKLVVGYNDYSSGNVAGLGWSYSDNQGSSWTRGGMFSISGYTRAINPIVAFDNAGACYYAGVVYNYHTSGYGQDGSIFLAKSNDGGRTFSVFKKIIATGSGVALDFDRPWMYINPANNHIYLAWVKRVNSHSGDGTERMTIWFTKSTNGGVTFSTPVQVGSDLSVSTYPCSHGPQIAVGAGSTVYVSWHTIEAGTLGNANWKPPKIWISQSADDGATFGESILVAIKQNSKPALFISMETHPASGRIYIAYCERPTYPGDMDIYVATAPSAAGPWTSKRVNDDALGNAVDQWYPVLDVAPNGRVDVIWYDYREGSANRHVYYSASRNQGATWETNTWITDDYGPGATYAGDYVGCIASQSDKAIAVWGDTRMGSTNQEVYSTVLSMDIPPEIIVDDVNAAFVGTWTLSTETSGYYGSGYKYHAAGTGDDKATWSFNIPTAGYWQVYARWTSGSDRATNAGYTIHHATGVPLDIGIMNLLVNQEINGGSWVNFGNYLFKAGTYSVDLRENANGIVIADAIKLVSTSALYSLAVNVDGFGTVAKSPDEASYAPGTMVTLTAIPEDDCSFNGWSGALTGNTNPTTITMNGDKTVIATFTIQPSAEVNTATATGTAYSASNAGTISDFSAVNEATLPTAGKPAGVTFPDGLFSFTIEGLTPGQTVTVYLKLPSSVPIGSEYWKYHQGVGWFSMPIGSDDGDNMITITLTDGGTGDADGSANGRIVDPGAPGSAHWTTTELLPSSVANKAGRTMPIKFSIRTKASVDPAQPFIRNEELTIKIYQKGIPATILQTSTYGTTSTNYRIDPVGEKYITNFKTLNTPTTYVVEIYRKDTLLGSFEFKTTK